MFPYLQWNPIKFKFAPGSLTLGGKVLSKEGDFVPKGTQTRDL